MAYRGLSDAQVKALAFEGAQAHHRRLTAEITQLERSFPGLVNGFVKRRKPQPKRSAQSLKAQSLKMKKLWAEKKKAAKTKGTEAR